MLNINKYMLIMIDVELQKELRMRFNPEGSDLRRAQLRMVEMLKFFDSVCKQHKMTYWLDSGTLIGAARHGGFIPWDDDVDICMPIKDLKKFKKLMLNNNLSDEFVLQCHETDFYFLSSPSWCVLRDLKSEYIQNSHLHNVRKFRGLQIDLFGVEENTIEFLHYFCCKYQSKIIDWLLYKNCKHLAYLSYLPFRYCIIPTFRLLSVCSKKKYYRMGYGIPIRSKRYVETIFPISKISFEGYLFNAPSNSDKYLSNIYKNWKQVPEFKKVKTHNVKFKFWSI